MDRQQSMERLRSRTTPWDVMVIGGGATGASVALDAATRGYEVLLLEQADFASGTSSRSTKLIHGGVRYLEQGNVGLVREALAERTRLLANAPHCVHGLSFVIPAASRWEQWYYRAGLLAYDALAGRGPLPRSRAMSRSEVLAEMPSLQPTALAGGVQYYDAQFDDARLVIQLLQTAARWGAAALNRIAVTGVAARGSGSTYAVVCRDTETGEELSTAARVVINAAGPESDAIRRLSHPEAPPRLRLSQGSHLVVDGTFLPGGSALLVPKTHDGRVMFAIPWQGATLLGTTDISVEQGHVPCATAAEVDFLLETARRYLVRAPTRDDVRSVFAGLRPLVATSSRRTSKLDRRHVLRTEGDGVITITGGKWTTCRQMAEDAMNLAAQRLSSWPPACRTHDLSIDAAVLRLEKVRQLQSRCPADVAESTLCVPFESGVELCAADVLWAARYESARTIEDVLARRSRLLFLNAALAQKVAPQVAQCLASELGHGAAWQPAELLRFGQVVARYRLPS